MPPTDIDCTKRLHNVSVEPAGGDPVPSTPTPSPEHMVSWWDTAFSAWCIDPLTPVKPLNTPLNASFTMPVKS
jgi:hypothetical protein